MSLLVHELGQVLDRVLVLAPTEKSLRELFESMHFDLTTGIGAGQKMRLCAAAMDSDDKGGLRAFASFTLGRRAGLDVRISLLGMSLEQPLPASAWELAESYLLWLPPGTRECERFLALSVPETARAKPCVAAGLSPSLDAQGPEYLRRLGLARWSERHFSSLHHIEGPEAYFRDGLEWVLSFSA